MQWFDANESMPMVRCSPQKGSLARRHEPDAGRSDHREGATDSPYAAWAQPTKFKAAPMSRSIR